MTAWDAGYGIAITRTSGTSAQRPVQQRRSMTREREPKLCPPSVSKSGCRRVRRRKVCQPCTIDFHGLKKKHPARLLFIYLCRTQPSASTHGLLFYCGGGMVQEKACREVEGFSQPRQRRLTVQPRRASALIHQNQPAAIFEVRTRAMFHSLGRSLPLHRPASLEARGKWAMVALASSCRRVGPWLAELGGGPHRYAFSGGQLQREQLAAALQD